jgi:hypothetical protein
MLTQIVAGCPRLRKPLVWVADCHKRTESLQSLRELLFIGCEEHLFRRFAVDLKRSEIEDWRAAVFAQQIPSGNGQESP